MSKAAWTILGTVVGAGVGAVVGRALDRENSTVIGGVVGAVGGGAMGYGIGSKQAAAAQIGSTPTPVVNYPPSGPTGGTNTGDQNVQTSNTAGGQSQDTSASSQQGANAQQPDQAAGG